MHQSTWTSLARMSPIPVADKSKKVEHKFLTSCQILDKKVKRALYDFKNLTAKRKIFAHIMPASAETPNTVTSHLPGCNAAARSVHENKLYFQNSTLQLSCDCELSCLTLEAMHQQGRQKKAWVEPRGCCRICLQKF